MNINELVEEKKKGLSLTKEEIDFIIRSYNSGKISDSKMIDFMRIINTENFSIEETYYLADAMAHTGELLDISKKVGITIDKHSAGSLSDSTTLVFMSVLASLGVKNVKVLSEDFGDFKNTLERLKVFKGFNAKISEESLIENINKLGAGVIEETGQIAPVDKRLYKLRKRAKISSVPLVAASILAKKIATGASVLIFDVKTGEGAIVQSEKFALDLARYLVEASKLAGFTPASVVTNLDQPLGSNLGVRQEIEEVVAVLKAESTLYDSKLLDVSRELVIMALILSKVASGRTEANKMFEEAIASGKAMAKFKEIVGAYGGKFENINSSVASLLDGVTISFITAKEDGYLEDIILQKLLEGYTLLSNKSAKIKDENAGIVLLVREGTKVRKGDKLIRLLYSLDNKNFSASTAIFKDAIVISKTKVAVHKMFYKIIA